MGNRDPAVAPARSREATAGQMMAWPREKRGHRGNCPLWRFQLFAFIAFHSHDLKDVLPCAPLSPPSLMFFFRAVSGGLPYGFLCRGKADDVLKPAKSECGQAAS